MTRARGKEQKFRNGVVLLRKKKEKVGTRSQRLSVT